MNLTLKRQPRSDGCTLGELFINGTFFCYSLEPDDQGPHPAIPLGRYRVIITLSQRFGRRLPLVVDVPGRMGIRFHPGNTADDTDGCILLGNSKTENAVGQSRKALGAFQSLLSYELERGQTVWLTVEMLSVEAKSA
jgi:hypothetical protein